MKPGLPSERPVAIERDWPSPPDRGSAYTSAAMTAMTAFVESCLETVADSALAVERRALGTGRPRAEKLLHVLDGKKNILVTTHQHPDPDALAAGVALVTL